MEPDRRYWFSTTGYNYRMTNVAAAIGLAQIEKIDWHISRRRENAACYRECLDGIPALTLLGEKPWAKHACWMNNILLTDQARLKRDDVIVALADKGIETRPFFYPLHTLPMYRGNDSFPVAESLAARGISLPSSALLSRADIEYVAETLVTFLER
jgi:perosamine synthetase